MFSKKRLSRRGSGLIEAMLATFLIVLAAGETTYTFLAGEKKISETGRSIEAINYSQATLEELTSKGFKHPDLTATVDHPDELPQGSRLKEVFHGSRKYTIEDIKDEVTQETAYKKITAETKWTAGKKPDHEVLVTLLSNPDPYIPPLPLGVKLFANPPRINKGETSTLTWKADNATTAIINWKSADGASGTLGPVSPNKGSYVVSPPVTTTYTITVTGGGGTKEASVTVFVTCTPNCTDKVCGDDGCGGKCGDCPEGTICDNGKCVVPGVGPTAKLVANPPQINKGEASTLTWTTTNATTAIITWKAADGTSGTLGPVSPLERGSVSTGPLQVTTTYIITACDSTGVCAEASKTVTVIGSSPEVTLIANPPQINKGETSTLIWTSTNATHVTIKDGTGKVILDRNVSASDGDTISVKPDVTTVYTIRACNAEGVCVEVSKTVTVIGSPQATITANPPQINKGETSTLIWTSTNATHVTISWVSSDGRSGTIFGDNVEISDSGNIPQILNIVAIYTYTITAAGEGGTDTDTAIVKVKLSASTCGDGIVTGEEQCDPPNGTTCNNSCKTCSCIGKRCDEKNECGKLCSCPAGQVCHNGICCTPDCDGKNCGPDGCGGSCGRCRSEEDCCLGVCTPWSSCDQSRCARWISCSQGQLDCCFEPDGTKNTLRECAECGICPCGCPPEATHRCK